MLGTIAGALVLLWPATAYAHVTVSPSEAPKGGFTKLAFSVPNEEATANTTQLQVVFPENEPIAFVSVEPVPGWTAKVDTRKLDTPIQSDDGEVSEVVSQITWSGGQIKPGEFQEFNTSVGPLPDDADKLEFKALQTYDNGETVRWIETQAEGAPEPEHPAPTLTLTAATGDEHGGTGASDSASSESASSDSGGDDSNTLAIVALIVGGLGLITGGVALARSRRAA
jgi:uncharacterized protein